jgi:hypothetical protein
MAVLVHSHTLPDLRTHVQPCILNARNRLTQRLFTITNKVTTCLNPAGAWCGHEPCGPPDGWRHCRRQAQLLTLGTAREGQEDTRQAQG